MRRAGYNPTDVEVHDLINKIDNGSVQVDTQSIGGQGWTYKVYKRLHIFLSEKFHSSFLDEL